jgi:preprotein translocase subunit SecA
VARAERAFGLDNLMDAENMQLQHHINQAIRAYGIMKRDVDYMVAEGQVLIIDEFTGRIMYGRRYSEGLHQAIEAKEGVKIENEMKTLATITFQNYFRLYSKLSGMTGTAITERDEFIEIYNLDVVEAPTNKPMIRKDNPDVVYRTEQAKFMAAIQQIIACNEKGQPVLVGTVSVEKSELLSRMLKKRGIQHNVLNAKNHQKEAEIIAQAGTFGAVTIATNMAGRGTDIMLGGNAEYMATSEMRRQGFAEQLIVEATGFAETGDEAILEARHTFTQLEAKHKLETKAEAAKVIAAGGLFILGTERHESRRIDNQLRGRAGRQGDPGESRFYLSMEDDLMRLFGGERLSNIMETLHTPEDMPIEAKMVSSRIEGAQRKIEGQNFAIRKNVLKYDDVMTRQRELIYTQRDQVLEGQELKPVILKMAEESIAEAVDFFCAANARPEDWNTGGLREKYQWLIGPQDLMGHDFHQDDAKQLLLDRYSAAYEKRGQELGPELMRLLESMILLRSVDSHWMDHIDAMESLKRGIGLRAYAQQDPVVAYRMESFDMFEEMTRNIREETVQSMLTQRVRTQAETERHEVAKVTGTNAGGDGSDVKRPVRRAGKKVGPNDLCPCGSGKKYKNCCGDVRKN